MFRSSDRSSSARSSLSPELDEKLKDSATKYETERIQVLQQEREHVQKKTFTKWCNSFLEKVHMQVNDLYTDLADGKMLMKLLEIISGENFGRPNRGVLRVQKMENVARCLQFLATKVTFENIGAEDIVDGNPRLILGLIWTIILRFQIQDIVIEVNESEDTGEKKSAQDALLLWCQKKTEGYKGVKIENFSSSWRNGLAFNALIHAHRPDLINFNGLNPADHLGNLNNAFNVADDKLGIAKLLDAEDVDVPKPDNRSIMTYVAAYYHHFAKMKSEVTGTKRIAKVLGGVLDLEHLQDDYDTLVSTLLDWINGKIVDLNDRHYPNTLDGIRKEMNKFTDFRLTEKPPKYRERGNIEVLFFNIQAKLKAGGRRMFVPKEGKLIRDIESAWIKMEKAEHERELSLREELIRQERLEQLAEKFERKAVLRESWLTDMTTVLSDQNFGSNTTQVEAALKKHEAIAADINSRKDRFAALSSMVQELHQENYHGRENVRKREQQILAKWQHLMDLLDKKYRILNGYNELLGMFREIESIGVEMKDMEPLMKSEDTGKHLLGAEDLIQKHNLIESQLNAVGGRIRGLNKRAQPHMKSLHPEAQLLQKRLEPLNKDYENLHALCQARKANLDESLTFFQFLQDAEEEEAWLVERIRLAKSQDVGKDLISCMTLIKRHEALEQEMLARVPRCEQLCSTGETLIRNGHYAKKDIGSRVAALRDKWQRLRELVTQRKTRLDDAAESHQYYADANEAESWMREKMPLVCSEDFGKDEPTAKNLLQRHNMLDEEIKAYGQDIDRLDQLAALMTKAAAVANVPAPARLAVPRTVDREEEDEDAEPEYVDVPYEYEVEETREQEVMKEEVVERTIPQIRAQYAYKGNGMEAEKGEVLLLIQKTNADWWSARRDNGQEGYLPANYVKEIEPRVIKKVVKKPVKVPVKVMVPKTGVKREIAKKKKGSALRRTPSSRSQANLHFDKENVEQRQTAINTTYKKVCSLSQTRRKNLEDAIVFFRFCRECDNFESWMADKEAIMETKESLSQNMEAIKRKHEALITDLAANANTIDEINKQADAMIGAGHSKSDAVKKRQREVNDRWKRLQNLKMKKEKSLAGASGIELFQKMCDELKGWIGDKINTINPDDTGKDLASVKALQRKHQNLEQELKPLEDKLKKMNLIANDVRKSYPDEAGHVNERENEIMAMWKALQDKAQKHKKLLDDAEEMYKFKEEAKALENYMNEMKTKLREKQVPHDVGEADALLKQHQDMYDDIAANRDRLNKMIALAEKMLEKDPNNKELQEKLRQLKAERDALDKMWDDRNKELLAAKDLQVMMREANLIDSVTASHDAFLDFDDLGSTAEGVDALLKRHEDFENTLEAQEERMRQMDELADRLIREGHPDAKKIDERRKAMRAKLEKAKAKAADRHNQLAASQALQDFKRDAEELSDWIKEKYVTACDESYRDLSNLLPKLQKHQALEAELKANKDRLDDINNTGNKLVTDGHYAAPEVKDVLKDLNSSWKQLDDKSKDKGTKLRQAAQQELLNKALEDANAKLTEMEKMVSSDDIGKDLRSVRDLRTKHQLLEKEMAMNAENLKSIVEQGNQMARAGHFDSASILKAVKDFDKRFNALQDPMTRRRQKLDDSLKWHQYNFDVDSELQWIKDHRPAATSTEYGKNLSDVQNLVAKQKKLDVELQGHQPMIDKVELVGRGLIKSKHFASPAIEEKTQELTSAWGELLDQSGKRKKNLDQSLRKHKYLSEADDVQTWLGETKRVISSEDYGKDEIAADKHLANHKAIESEIKTYGDVTKNLATEANKLQKDDPINAKEIATKQSNLETQLGELTDHAGDRRKKLDGSKAFHEFMREGRELDDWINEQTQTAMSEDYGQDYEHIQVVQSKFSDFQHAVEAGTKRYQRVDKMATLLIDANNPQSRVIQQRKNKLENAFQNLLQLVDAREQKLNGASELHRFNRDVEDAMSRILEKYGSIPEDLGRDLKAVQTYRKKHENFETELAALGGQLQILVDDSERLKAKYPGGNAEHIARQMTVVIDNWRILEEKSAQRKSDLEATKDLYLFLSEVKSLIGWAEQTQAEMGSEEHANSVAAVTDRQTRHLGIKSEIDARERSFSDVVESGRMMIANGHFAANEINDRVQDVLETRNQLHEAWHAKKAVLDQLLDQQTFLRDAHQLELLSNSQEIYLKGTELGSTVDQVEALIKKHDAFENVLTSQDAKLEALKEFGERLIKEKHFDSKNIKQVLDNVVKRRLNLKELSAQRKNKLADSLLYSQFNRDVAEAEGWIEDKLKIAKQENFKMVKDMQEKMKSLKKHQAFESEIMANADRIKTIKTTGETLLKKRHEASPEIQLRVNSLIQKWNELLQASNERGKGLEEAKDILKFNEEVEKVEDWSREKETLIAACDLGRDYEHCLALQKKVNDVEGGVTVDEERINSIKKLADKLISQGRTETKVIQDRKDSIVSKWQKIQGDLASHKNKLDIALEIHAFNRDLDDINDRINEKAAAMSSEDFGKDLSGIQALQRKQEDVEKDMTAIHQQIQKMNGVYGKLCKKYPDMVENSEKKLRELEENWTRLEDLANARKLKLEDSYQLHKFLSDAKEHMNWCSDLVTTMNSGSLATSVPEAEEQLQAHIERKTEIAGRMSHYQSLIERGEKLIGQQRFPIDQLKKTVAKLEKAWSDLNDNWDRRKQMLTQLYDLQVYEEYADQADQWLSSKEAFIANEDMGNSLSSVDVLVKKHDGFVTTLAAQEEKITDLEKLAQALLEQDHYASDKIRARCQGVVDRLERVKQAAEARRRKLVESRNYQQFLGSVYEVMGWISEKMQVALDESYRDPVNLQGKIQKHQAFEAELMANRKRVDIVTEEGQGLISQKHYAERDIREQLQHLEDTWQGLVAATQEKKDRLQEAYQALSFHRLSDDTEAWMEDVETQLSSEDHGKDIISVNNLLKKHQLLEDDITKHKDKVQSLQQMAGDFKQKRHFMSDDLQSRAKKILVKYNNLGEPCQIRHDNLEDSLLLHTYYRDVEDELSWIREKRPIAAMTDLGTNLSTVQNLQKKHHALENEIIAHEPLIEAVKRVSQVIVDKKHPATKDVLTSLDDLQARLKELKTLSAERKAKLLDAVESQTFYAESAEADQWMNDRRPQLTSKDFGKDEDSTQALLKKLDALELDIDNFQRKIKDLESLSDGLVARKHFDSENIRRQQEATEAKYAEQQELAAVRRRKLIETKKLFEFFREADDIVAWIREKEAIAGSEDYGTDIEHVQILQQKFNEFMRDLLVSEERITQINSMADGLISAGHGDSPVIKKRQDQINGMWAGVKELAEARQQSLAGAKKVHAFVRDADDTIEWIEEKDLIASSEDFGQDIETVKALTVKHEVFERDLAAISEQVENTTATAKALLASFPDAQEHIASKHEEMVCAWNALIAKAQLRKDRLHQAQNVQLYFDDYRGLCAWCNEMQARITADDLPRDVAGAEVLQNRHRENKAEIDSRLKDFARFTQKGKVLVAEKNFLSAEIQEKIDHLDSLLSSLNKTWQDRHTLYEQAHDLEMLKREMAQLDSWMNARKPIVEDETTGESIAAIEEALQKHNDFEQMVFAQQDRFNAIKRMTKLEKAFHELKKMEEVKRIEEEKRREKEKLEEKKRREHERILEERRRDEENRKAQEILQRRKRDIESENNNMDAGGADAILGNDQVSNLINRTNSGNERDMKAPVADYRQQKAAPPSRVAELVEYPQSPGHRAPSTGLTTTDAWKDGGETPTKKVARTDSQKREKRQRTLSLKTKKPALLEYKGASGAGHPLPAEMEGFLERKHELQRGQVKAAVRSWKQYYTVLCGQLLCFFKDKKDFAASIAAAPPLPFHGATCESAADYTKKKNVIRLSLPDGSEYLFTAPDQHEMTQWLNKIQFHAVLPPALQLMQYDADLAQHMGPASPSQRAARTSDGDSPTSGGAPGGEGFVSPPYSPQSEPSTPPALGRRSSGEAGTPPKVSEPVLTSSRRQPKQREESRTSVQGADRGMVPDARVPGPPTAQNAPPLPPSVPPPNRAAVDGSRSSRESLTTGVEQADGRSKAVPVVTSSEYQNVLGGASSRLVAQPPSSQPPQKPAQPPPSIPSATTRSYNNGEPAPSSVTYRSEYGQPAPTTRTSTTTVSASLPRGSTPPTAVQYEDGSHSSATLEPDRKDKDKKGGIVSSAVFSAVVRVRRRKKRKRPVVRRRKRRSRTCWDVCFNFVIKLVVNLMDAV